MSRGARDTVSPTPHAYKLNNVCNAYPRTVQDRPAPRISAECAQQSIIRSLYHNILCLSMHESIFCGCVLTFRQKKTRYPCRTPDSLKHGYCDRQWQSTDTVYLNYSETPLGLQEDIQDLSPPYGLAPVLSRHPVTLGSDITVSCG